MPPRTDHQHPPVVTAAADGSHTQGCMIALMPTAEDAERLAIPGGEPAEELHCTLYYLGKTDAHDTDSRTALADELTALAQDMPQITAKVFGAAHWNGDSDEPSWVWSVGDGPDEAPVTEYGAGLEAYRSLAAHALLRSGTSTLIPKPHSPWVAHICAAYSDDPAMLTELERRLGEVTFDRIRLSFGDDDRDIPLTGDAVTAAAGPLRREPTELELASRVDFASVHREWEAATSRAAQALRSVTAAWRLDLRQQITRDLADDALDSVPELTLDSRAASGTLLTLMEEYAVKAGRACQREAEQQGVTVPNWSLPDGEEDAVTAALTGRRLLTSVAELTSDLMSGALLTAAKRKLSGLLRSNRPTDQIAAEVDRELATVDDTSVRAAVGSAMTAAQNAGRHAVLEAAPPASSYVASEILDRRTCGPCKDIDGRTFTSLDSAVAEYPVMGYRDCTGARYGNACRGFIIAVWQEVRSPATTAAGHIRHLHGTPGRPSYRKYHPSGRNKDKGAHGGPLGKTRHANGGWLGSNRFSEQEHEDTLYDYTGRAYRDMNAHLRRGEAPRLATDEENRRRISILTDLAAVQDPTSADQTVYRGTRGLRLGLKDGDEFHDKGFSSTSVDKGVAESMTGVGGALIRIKVPKGSQVIDVQALGAGMGEDELILPPGSKFRVTRAVEPDDPTETAVYDVELING
jgi:2'-5' RNA ligase